MSAPVWAYRLVEAVMQYEYEHAKGAACLHEALDTVPQDVQNGVRIASEILRAERAKAACDD